MKQEMLKSLPQTEARVEGRALFLICAYGAAGAFSFADRFPRFGRLARIADRLTACNLRRFIANNRDFAANPRSFGYQLGLVEEILGLGHVTEATCLVAPPLSEQLVTNRFEKIGKVEIRDLAKLSVNDLQGFDVIVVVYPDALGLGQSRMEAGLLEIARVPVVFVNGRRRIMRLDSSARRALAWRRLLASSRVTELGLSLLILPLAMFWATIDALRGRS
jgi:hypothetical protein